MSRPLATRDQDFRVLDHDRRFGAGFDRREMSALPPDTHRPGRAASPPGPPAGRRRGASGEEETRRRLDYDHQLEKEHVGARRQKARSAHLLPPAERVAGGIRTSASLPPGLSTSAFITKSVFGRDPPRRSRRPSVEHEAVAQILGRPGADPRRAPRHRMHLGEAGADRALIEEAVRPLTEMRAVCFKALGRKP